MLESQVETAVSRMQSLEQRFQQSRMQVADMTAQIGSLTQVRFQGSQLSMAAASSIL